MSGFYGYKLIIYFIHRSTKNTNWWSCEVVSGHERTLCSAILRLLGPGVHLTIRIKDVIILVVALFIMGSLLSLEPRRLRNKLRDLIKWHFKAVNLQYRITIVIKKSFLSLQVSVPLPFKCHDFANFVSQI